MLILKPHTREEIPLRIKWLNNKIANRYAVDNPDQETTLEKQTKWFDDYDNNLAKKFFTIFFEEVPVGFMGLSKIDLQKGSAELFIMIGEDNYRGKGIGKDSMNYLINFAFKELKLNKILLGVDPNNLPAVRLYKYLGFKEIKIEKNNIEMELDRG